MMLIRERECGISMSRNGVWKILTVFAIVFACLMMFTGNADAATEGDFEYSVSSDGATITGYTGTGGAVTIPSTLGGYDVISIDSSAFSENTTITSISIPSSVTALDSGVFEGCTGLVTIIFEPGSTISAIPGRAFYGCTSLTTITIPESVTSIGGYYGDYTFEGCTSLVTITIPDAVTFMGSYTFRNCTALEEVVFGEDSLLKTIGTYDYTFGGLFKGCSSLVSLYLPKLIDVPISETDFEGCTSLTSFSVHPDSKRFITVDGVLCYKSSKTVGSEKVYYASAIYVYPAAKAGTSYTVPETISSLASGAFQDCKLTSIDLSSSQVTAISSHVFRNCTQLTSISIPATIESINSTAFEGCISLSAFIVDSNSEDFSSSNGILFDKDASTLVRYPIAKVGTSYTLPTTVDTIGANAFEGCVSLESVVITSDTGRFWIGNGAFEGCTSLDTISITGSIGYLSIGSGVFKDCPSALKMFTFSKSGSSETVAFTDSDYKHECTDFTGDVGSLYLSWHYAPYWISYDPYGDVILVAYDDRTVVDLTVPDVIGDKPVVELGDAIFENFSKLTSISLPNSIKKVGTDVFSGCISLKSVNIPSQLTVIKDDMFEGCTSLAQVTIPEGITEIGDRAFMGCHSLKGLEFPDSLRDIEQYAFYNCIGLASITIDTANSQLRSIREGAFENCISLVGISLPSNSFVLGSKVFKNCRSITSMVIPEVHTVPSGFLEGCVSLKTVVIPEGVSVIGSYVFKGCESLTTLSIPRNITEIGFEAICGLRSLTSVTVSPDNDRYYSIDGVLYEDYKNGIYLTLYPSNKSGDVYTMPDDVEYIRNLALLNNPHIKTWILSESLVHDAEGLLPSGCSNLESIQISTNNGDYHSEDGVLYNKSKTMVLCYPAARPGDTYAVLNDTLTIGYCSFEDTRFLETIILPDSVTLIEVGAFQNGSKLKTVMVGNGVTEVDGAAFTNCDSIESIQMSIPALGRTISISPDQMMFWADTSVIKSKDGNGFVKIEYDYVSADEDFSVLYSVVPAIYSVAFESNGGDGAMPSLTFEMQESKALPANVFERPLYEFVSWNTKSDGSGVSYTDTQVVSGMTTVSGSTVVLYAQWAPTEYHVEFDPNGGFGEMEGQTLTVYVPTALKENTYAYDQKKFVSWNTKSDGSGVSYTDMQVITDVINKGFDVTLYAQWADLDKYPVTFIDTDGSVFESQMLTLGTTIVCPEAVPYKGDDYMFTYSFHEWTGYVEGMSVTGSHTFYPVFVAYLLDIDEPVNDTVEVNAPAEIVDIGGLVTNVNNMFANGTIDSFDIEFDDGAISIDGDAFSSIDADNGSIGVLPVEDVNVPNNLASKTGDRPVYNVFIGGIHEFEGNLTISFNYQLGEGESSENLRIWHFDSNGNYVEEVCTYDAENQKVTFTTDNLSYFSIMHIVGGSDPDNGPEDDDGGMGIGLIIGIVVGVIAVAGIGVFVFLRTRP